MTTLDHQIRERLETCNWYGLRALLHAALECHKPRFDGPFGPLNHLAEPTVDGGWTRCGHGWTRKRALRDLDRHVAGVQ